MKFLLILVCLLMASMVMALPVHNVTQATDYATIQDAINAANDYDVITVDAGTYLLTSSITIDRPIDLRGAQYGVDPRPSFGSARTAGSAGETILDGQGVVDRILYLNSAHSDTVFIDGFEIKSGTGDMVYATSGSLQTWVEVRNNIIHDAQGDEGVQLKFVEYSHLMMNYVYDTFGDGLNISDGSHSCTIVCNELMNISSENAAIYCYGSEYTSIEGNLIDGTNINDGIKLGSKDGSDAADRNAGTIAHNTVFNTLQDGIAVYQSDAIIHCNEVFNSTSENGAIYVGFAVDNVNIYDNYVHDCGPGVNNFTTHAIRIGKSSYNPTQTNIYGNCLVNNQSNGYDQTSGQSFWNANYYDDYLTNANYPGSYLISGGANVDASYSTTACGSVGEACTPPDCATESACVPEDALFDGTTDVGTSQCIQLCEDASSRIRVLNLAPGQYPVVTKRLGCTEPCDDPCAPATYIQEFFGGLWQYNENLNIFWLEIRGDGCICVTLDDILAVELNSFSAISGDGVVQLAWSTASETNNDHFELLRNDVHVANIAAINNPAGSHYNWTDTQVENGRLYSYKLIAVDVSGNRTDLATTDAAPGASATISEYALHQNYPNPFNPETNIRFDLVESGNVTLAISNALGQTVATLVNGNLAAGSHTVTFEALDLPSGIYFYRLTTNDFHAVRKMVLMK